MNPLLFVGSEEERKDECLVGRSLGFLFFIPGPFFLHILIYISQGHREKQGHKSYSNIFCYPSRYLDLGMTCFDKQLKLNVYNMIIYHISDYKN